MRLYIFLFLVQTGTVLSKQNKGNEQNCENKMYEYNLHTYKCDIEDGEFDSSYADLLKDYFTNNYNMTPSFPLTRVSCALENHVNIPKGCGFTFYTATFRGRLTREQKLRQLAEGMKHELDVITRRKPGETVSFFLNCYGGTHRVTCAAKTDSKKRNKEKCTSQKRPGQKTPEESRAAPTAKVASGAAVPRSKERESLKHSPPVDSPGKGGLVGTPEKEQPGPSHSAGSPDEGGPHNQSIPASLGEGRQGEHSRPPTASLMEEELSSRSQVKAGSHRSSPPGPEMDEAGEPPATKDEGGSRHSPGEGLEGSSLTEA
ncbi:unnamed protein product [Cylicocyclus nassatus]|uniref:Secreted protein n=1 Tax=Cylicocyclus nassatus TaxID=53992 RepID=A0AA36MA03_CYLNA|nr:unnamed protein product [Cylicocyclus nassatus]